MKPSDLTGPDLSTALAIQHKHGLTDVLPGGNRWFGLRSTDRGIEAWTGSSIDTMAPITRYQTLTEAHQWMSAQIAIAESEAHRADMSSFLETC